ncbi:MAG: hypothetical protein HY514_00710 [Candidatus Aenigmarchaeota archaeon]|nr:hypothetical protein [Candidatus Aenigmarchaeota archaeon]
MALEEQEIKQLEERFERLENKLRATFLEVEKRFEEAKAQPHDIEDRIQELEDLILLMQLEITKIKERGSITTEFLTPEAPDLHQRLSRMEEALSLKLAEKEPPQEEGEEKLFEEPETIRTAEEEEEKYEEEQDGMQPELNITRRHAHEKSLLKEVQQILSG